MNQNREYRTMVMNLPKSNEHDYVVEGYASTTEPYALFEDEGVTYYERIEPTAFDNADMSDVVFRLEHEGAVYARTKSGDLSLRPDAHGLHSRADLSRTQRSMDVWEEINAGHYSEMSFAFVVGKEHYERVSHTRVIDEIAKVYDVSPVAFPANPTTNIQARAFIDGEIEKERAERREAERREQLKKRIKILLEVQK